MFKLSHQQAKVARFDVALENARQRYEKVPNVTNARAVSKALRDLAAEWDKMADMMRKAGK